AIAEIEKLIARKIDWQDGAQLPPDDEVEATPRRERSPSRGGARKRDERAAPVEGGERPDRHSDHRADSRRHRAERPPRERIAADQERAAAPPASVEPPPRRERPARERVAAN